VRHPSYSFNFKFFVNTIWTGNGPEQNQLTGINQSFKLPADESIDRHFRDHINKTGHIYSRPYDTAAGVYVRRRHFLFYAIKLACSAKVPRNSFCGEFQMNTHVSSKHRRSTFNSAIFWDRT
jgi:hypothetical protein